MYTRLLTGPRRLVLLLTVPILGLIALHSAAPAYADSTFPVGTQAYVALDDTEFYNQPDYGASVVGRLPHGAIVQISQEPRTPESGVTWYGITVNGAGGWIPGDDISHSVNAAGPVVWPNTPTPAPPTAAAAPPPPTATPARSGDARGGVEAPEARAARVVSTAMSYKGSRYVLGGISPSGFDCSGFVYFIFNKAGIPLGRAMWDQINAGQHIAAADLRPGDLVYFKNTFHKGVSHIAIYIGNGKIVHACNEHTGVTVSNLWSPYWVAHYAGAVRIVH